MGLARRSLLGWVLVAMTAVAQAQPSTASAEGWQRLVGILQYLEADYPQAVETRSEFELEEQRQFISDAVALSVELGAPARVYEDRLASLKARIDQAQDPTGVPQDARRLIEDVVAATGMARSPSAAPDLKKGAALFEVACAACHGKEGKADTEIAPTMDPRPRNFHDPEAMEALTPYKAFNTVSFGVPGTAMPSFSTLSDDERWSLAFFVLSIRHPRCDQKPPRTSLEELANSTDAQLREKFGTLAPCLRTRPPAADREALLLKARAEVERSIQLFAQGDYAGARNAVLDGYLGGLEPVEPQLRASSPALIARLEEAFLQTRLAVEERNLGFEAEAKNLLGLLDQARRTAESARGFWSVFWMSLFILLREGFEATIVIAALLAVLKKMDQTQHAKVVHAGWISAIVLGALAFILGRQALAAADRELLEGITALAAVAMLIYAALWLNARANIRKFMGELRQKMQSALGRQSLIGLFAVSFMAMFRESLETVIFLQGLAADAPAGAAWGAVIGTVVLLALVMVIKRVGFVLPMKALFNVSTVLLLATAVILLGKGLHAFQEVGVLPLRPLPFVTIEWLGVFPDAWSLIPQLVLLLTPLLWAGMRKNQTLALTP